MSWERNTTLYIYLTEDEKKPHKTLAKIYFQKCVLN